MKTPSSFLLFSVLACLISANHASAETSSPSSQEAVDLLAMENWAEPGEWAHAAAVKGSASEKKWSGIKPGSGILFNGQTGKTVNLVSKSEHGDVELFVEFMIPKSSNSGIYLMNRYEVQILDSFGKPDDSLQNHDCGGIYERWDESKEGKDKGYEGTAPSTNASTAPGSWQKYRIIFRAPRFAEDGSKSENARFVVVEHNGVVIHQDVEVTGPTRGGAGGKEVARGPLKIQGDHGPVAFRKFLVKDLKLD